MDDEEFDTSSPKPGELVAGWGMASGKGAINYAWGGKGAQGSDARILSDALESATVFDGNTLLQELEVRGYDLSTLKFSVKLKSC